MWLDCQQLKQNAQMLARDDGKKKGLSPTMEVMRQLKKHLAKLERIHCAPQRGISHSQHCNSLRSNT
jgi:hypothetical protein